MKILKRMNKSNNRKNSGFTLVELVIVMAIMGILGLAVVGFIGTSTKQYKYATKDVDLQYEAQLTMNQIGNLIIDAQKGVKYEPATVAAPVEVASVNPEAGYIATASAEEASSEQSSSDSKLIICNNDCTYNIIYRPSEHKIYLRKDTLDPATGAVVLLPETDSAGSAVSGDCPAAPGTRSAPDGYCCNDPFVTSTGDKQCQCAACAGYHL